MSSFFSGRKSSSEEPTTPPIDHFPQPANYASGHQPIGFDTVLGSHATLKGDLRSQANVRLDGAFEGILEIDGNVLVGETARITADIHAKNVSIAGAVRGNVSGKKVQLLRTARVWGNISATAIQTEEGAFIDGKITMITHEAAQAFDTEALPVLDSALMETPPGHSAIPELPAPSELRE